MMLRVTLLILVGMLAAGNIVSAHHSASKVFDMSRTVRITGKITKVEWTNPHIWILVHGTNNERKVGDWTVEAAAPHILQKAGIEKDRITVGEVVSIEGNPAKEQTRLHVNGLTLILPNGRKLDIHDRWGEAVFGIQIPQPASSQR
jgi:hypothetical protein